MLCYRFVLYLYLHYSTDICFHEVYFVCGIFRERFQTFQIAILQPTFLEHNVNAFRETMLIDIILNTALGVMSAIILQISDYKKLGYICSNSQSLSLNGLATRIK